MNQFFNQGVTFRLSTNPKGGQAYIDPYKFLSRYNLKPLLDYIREEFSDSPTLKVRRTTFSLVNITSEFINMSIGTEDTPSDPMILRSPLTLTFAMRRRDTVEGRARHVIWNTGHTCVCGNNLQRSHDFLTISVPLNIIQECGLNRMLRPNLERLYQVLGGYTKSLALDKKSVADSNNIQSIYRLVFYKNLPVVAWYYTFDDLFFCCETWELNAGIITGELTDTKIEYYLRYLTRYGNSIRQSSNAYRIVGEIEDRIQSDVITMKYTDNYLYYVMLDLYPNVIETYRKGVDMQASEIVALLMEGDR